jgi:hypothetical protein
MQRQEIRSLADLAGEGSRVVTTLVRDMHEGIASRVSGAVGPSSKPTQVVHDTIAAMTYRAVDRALRASLGAAGAVAAELWSRDEDTVQSHPTVAGAVAALNESTGMSWPTGTTDSR